MRIFPLVSHASKSWSNGFEMSAPSSSTQGYRIWAASWSSDAWLTGEFSESWTRWATFTYWSGRIRP
jgi:hypothetical protein